MGYAAKILGKRYFFQTNRRRDKHLAKRILAKVGLPDAYLNESLGWLTKANVTSDGTIVGDYVECRKGEYLYIALDT